MEFSNKPSFNIYCKADPKFSLTIRNGVLILAPSKPSDPLQHWYKNDKFLEGVPSFALVNKATGQAIKHSENRQPVRLVFYNPNVVDKSVLWTQTKDSESGYKSIRMVTNSSLYIDACGGHAADGTSIILWPRNHANNQWWKIEQHSPSSAVPKEPTFRVYCKTDTKLFLTIRDGKVILAPSNPIDSLQLWYKDEKYGSMVKDNEGVPSFALINKASGQAIQHSNGVDQKHVQLVPYYPSILDKSILWTEGKDSQDGYKSIRSVTDSSLNMNVQSGDCDLQDGTYVRLCPRNYASNQWWKIKPH